MNRVAPLTDKDSFWPNLSQPPLSAFVSRPYPWALPLHLHNSILARIHASQFSENSQPSSSVSNHSWYLIKTLILPPIKVPADLSWAAFSKNPVRSSHQEFPLALKSPLSHFSPSLPITCFFLVNSLLASKSSLLYLELNPVLYWGLIPSIVIELNKIVLFTTFTSQLLSGSDFFKQSQISLERR